LPRNCCGATTEEDIGKDCGVGGQGMANDE
jgi:hypothetical protein